MAHKCFTAPQVAQTFTPEVMIPVTRATVNLSENSVHLTSAAKCSMLHQHAVKSGLPTFSAGWRTACFFVILTDRKPTDAGRQLTHVSLIPSRVHTSLCIAQVRPVEGATPCRYCENQRFGGTCRLHLQGGENRRGTALPVCYLRSVLVL
jgi:hypothetical protein